MISKKWLKVNTFRNDGKRKFTLKKAFAHNSGPRSRVFKSPHSDQQKKDAVRRLFFVWSGRCLRQPAAAGD